MVDDLDLAALTEVVRSGQSLSSGGYRDRFEHRFAELVNARYALSVTSGTVALEIAIRLLDLQPGDEVIVTPQTFQATIQPLLSLPVTVRFCDVEPGSLNLDPSRLSDLITERTRAVLLVHYGGLPARMDEITRLTRHRGITVIEDCAHALGANTPAGRPGNLADIGCFSFHSSKNITTLGEGGMITFNRPGWAERVDRIRSNQIDGRFQAAPGAEADAPPELPWMKFATGAYDQSCLTVTGAGTNATLSEAAAAVGLVQLDKLQSLTDRRRRIADELDRVLSGYPDVALHNCPPGYEHAHHLYTFFLDSDADRRYRLIRELDRRGVEVQLRYFPLHLLPEWRLHGHGPGECPTAERIWFNQHMNLPCHPELTDYQVEYLLSAVDAAMAGVHTLSHR